MGNYIHSWPACIPLDMWQENIVPTPTPLTAAQNEPSMAVEACSKMVEAATKSCVAAPQQAGDPNWDAMATSFSSLSLAFTWGTIILAVIALIGAIAWGWFVKGWAEKEARIEAEKCATATINEWLSKEAPQIIRRHVEYLNDTSVGKTDDGKAADEIGEAAG